MKDAPRTELAGWLERLAQQPEWNDEVWRKCHDLVKANWADEAVSDFLTVRRDLRWRRHHTEAAFIIQNS